MKRLLTLFIVILSIKGYSQKIRLTDTSNRWHYCWFYWGTNMGEVDYYFMDSRFIGDTVVGGVSYKLFQMESSVYPDLMREDTTDHKVYVILNVLGNLDTQDEELLYDFSLGLGDTLQNNLTSKHYVSNIDSTLINNVWHKVWYLSSSDNTSYPYYVIEGLGCLNTMYYPLDPVWALPHLCCFSNSQSTPPLNPPIAGLDNLTSCTLNITDKQLAPISIEVFPNPADENTIMKFDREVISGRLSIYDGLGRSILSLNISSAMSAEIGQHLTIPGVYFYRFSDLSSGRYLTGQIIK